MGNEIIFDFKRDYKQGKAISKEHYDKMLEASSLLDKAENEFKDAIRREAMKL